MLGLDSPPTRIDLPEHTASCLSPDGRWLAMIGRYFGVTLYDLDATCVPRRLACRQDERTPVELTLAGTPDDGLLAIVHVHYSEDHEPRAQHQTNRLELRALPDGELIELGEVEDLPDDGIDLVDALHAPHGFDAPTLLFSTPTGGMLTQRTGTSLSVTTSRTRGRLLAAHPTGGLAVSTQFGVCIETPDGPVQSLGHDRAPLDERFAFSAGGERAVWLRDRLLTALVFDDEDGWSTIATHEVPDGCEVLGLASGALLWRQHGDGQAGMWRWDRPFDDLRDVDVPGEVDHASVSALGEAVLCVSTAEGRLVVAPDCSTPAFELRVHGMMPTGSFTTTTHGDLTACSPDGRHGVVWLYHGDDGLGDEGRHRVSIVLWDLELQRSSQVLVEREPVRRCTASYSTRGVLAVAFDHRLQLWHPEGGTLHQVADLHLPEVDGDALIPAWLTPDILAVTSPHSDVALLFDDQGHPRPPDHFGPWGFQIPYVGRYSATGRRTQDLYGTTRLTGAVGRTGQVTIELQPSTWQGAERGSQTTMLAYHQGPAGLEVAAVELPHAARMIFGNLAVLDRGRYVVVPIFGPIRSCRVYRVDESPLKFECVAFLQHIQAFATIPDHPWLFTLPTGDEPMLEIRHADDPTTVVERVAVPPGACWIETHTHGRLLQIACNDGSRWQWRLDLD